MSDQKINTQEEIKREIDALMLKVKDENISETDRLNALKTLNSLLELNVAFIRSVKKQLEK